jgi:hypothetical protein
MSIIPHEFMLMPLTAECMQNTIIGAVAVLLIISTVFKKLAARFDMGTSLGQPVLGHNSLPNLCAHALCTVFNMPQQA